MILALLGELPDEKRFQDILVGVLGSESDKTGIAGVLRILRDIDTDNLASSFVSQLDDTISADISVDTTVFTSGVFNQFNQAVNSLPSDPRRLVAPLCTQLENIKNLTSGELSDRILESIEGLQNIQSLVPVDTGILLSDAAEGITRLREQFISGGWGELRQWSSSVQGLCDEISPLFIEDKGNVEDRLVTYFNDKMTALGQIILPQQQGFAQRLSSQLDLAISADRVSRLQTIKTELITHIDNARVEFESGNFSNITHLNAAKVGFDQLTGELADIVSSLSSVLACDIATADGMINALKKQFDDVESVEIIDLGNIKDKFLDALKSAEETLSDLKLETMKETIEGMFDKIKEVIDQFHLDRLCEKLTGLQVNIHSVLDEMDTILFEVVASIRNILAEIKEALSSVTSILGNYDENGEFRFLIVQDFTDVLERIKITLGENIQPKLNDFKKTIGQTLLQIRNLMESVRGDIESVKTDLFNTLHVVNNQLKKIDETGEFKEIRQQLDGMLSKLDDVDFDPVVDSVVKQINEMRDELKEIDFSSLNDTLKGMLKAAVEVVKGIDFPKEITEVLLSEIDEILVLPKTGLREIESKIEGALEKLSALEPNIILKPLDDVFDQVTERFDALKLEKLCEPLEDWYARIHLELNTISSEAVLHPVIDLYDQLRNTCASMSPDALIELLQSTIDNLKSELQGLDALSNVDELREELDNVKKLMDEISPESLFNPLVNAFNKIEAALYRFNPGDILEPFKDVFDRLMVPLDNLTDEHVRLIGETFANLKELPIALDPCENFQTAGRKYNEVLHLLKEINIGKIISDLKKPYDSLKATFEAGEIKNDNLKEIVDSLNPIQNALISQAATEFQDFQSRMQNTFLHEPSEDVINRYSDLRPRLESLVPDWVGDNMTAASIKAAFQKANPVSIAEEVNNLYDTFKEELQNLNPRTLVVNIKIRYENLRETFDKFDPKEIAEGINDVLSNITTRLDTTDLQIIREELEGLANGIDAVIAGINPQSIVSQLEVLTDEVRNVATELKPSKVFNDLDGQFQAVKDIMEAFDPDVLKKTLEEVFEEMQNMISQIDIWNILQPLGARLEGLQDELEAGLKRTEIAFNEMLTAIPV